MDTIAVLLRGPEDLGLERLDLTPPGEEDVVVEVEWSGISTGTERLLWSGRMPHFPGMGYPLVGSKKELAGEPVQIGDVCFKRDGVFAMELGGPEVGRGCGGRGIIHGFELLEKLGFHQWDFDYVLLDFLGDVVCGGFGLPIARDMCQKVIVVGSNDLQSLYVANNVCSAVEYFKKLGGNVGVAGMVINKDDGTGEAHAFAAAAGIPVLSAIPADDYIRRKSASYEIIGRPESTWGPMFA